MIPSPPSLEDYRVGHQLIAGMGYATIYPEIDFETYSPAGFVWNPYLQKFKPPQGSKDKGLSVVGMSVYTEHPEAEVLCMAYNLKDGFGTRQWSPGDPTPIDLFIYLQSGGIIEAWNVGFEYYVWSNICVPKYMFPPLDSNRLRCAAAKARAYSLPGSLDPCGKVLDIKNKKLEDGKRLIRRYCCPHDPTKKEPFTRINIRYYPDDHRAMLRYNIVDVIAEGELSSQIPDLSPTELEFWQADQRINRRGVRLDRELILQCIKIIEAAYVKYNSELVTITRGKVTSASQIQKIRDWMMEYGTTAPSLDEEHITQLLKLNIAPEVKRVLQIRQLIGSAAVKKLYAMMNRMSQDGRVRDLFIYHAARTGRTGGDGVQPQNLPNNNGVIVSHCRGCDKHYYLDSFWCMWCGRYGDRQDVEWNPKAIDDAISVLKTGSLSAVEYHFGEAVSTIAGCLRGMFVPADGHDFVSSDYVSIEGIVLPVLAGEEWQVEVYRTHGLMYEMTASKITGTSLEEYIAYKRAHGKHHKDRKLGKVAALSSGYQGWINAWLKFDAGDFMSEEEIKRAILSWRDANPMIVRFWKELETAAHMAVSYPNQEFKYREISYVCRNGILYCMLPSGRYLTYHRPSITPNSQRPGSLQLSFEGWNSNPQHGSIGWTRMSTYGGKLTENVVQATARDILAHAIVNLEKRGYPVVLHVHDEIVCEIPEGKGSVEELESIMMELPQWANGWPIKAAGGWRAKRYQK